MRQDSRVKTRLSIGGLRRYPAQKNMTEKFSKYVADAMVNATEEARSRNHDYLCSEHIFLGLMKTGGGVIQQLLDHFAITSEMVIDQIDQISQKGNMGEKGVPRDCSFPKTACAKTTLEIGKLESAKNGRSEIGQYDLMIGLLHEPRELLAIPGHPERMCNLPTVVTQALNNTGLDLESAREFVRGLLPSRKNE